MLLTAFRFLGWRGIAGLAVAVVLGSMLAVQKGETRHWHKQADRFEQLYNQEHAAFARTVINYRNAALKAKESDAANKTRVEAEQSTINQQSGSSYETRIADARARAAERVRNGTPAANPGSGRTAPVPGVPAPASKPDEAAGQDGLSADDKLIATEQAIQLDELIKWVKAQHAVDVNGAESPKASPGSR